MEALLAEGGPLEVRNVVDSEEEEAHANDNQSSDDDEDDEDSDDDDADVTCNYYADQEVPPEETSQVAPQQSALRDMLAGKKPDSVLENPGTAQTSNPTETNPPPIKGKGPSSGASGKAPAPKVPNNPGILGSTNTASTSLTPAAQGVQNRAQSSLFGTATLAHAASGEEQMVHNLENYTRLLIRLQQLVVVMAQGFQDASEDIRKLISSTLAWATERDRQFVKKASAAFAGVDQRLSGSRRKPV